MMVRAWPTLRAPAWVDNELGRLRRPPRPNHDVVVALDLLAHPADCGWPRSWRHDQETEVVAAAFRRSMCSIKGAVPVASSGSNGARTGPVVSPASRQAALMAAG